MANINLDGIKKILADDGITLDTSGRAKIADFKAIYNNTAKSNFEYNTCVVKGQENRGAVDSGTVDTDTKSRKKNLFKAHIHACKQWSALLFNENTKLEIKNPQEDEAFRYRQALNALAYLEKHYENYGVWPFLEKQTHETFGIGTVGVVTEYSNDYGILHKAYSADAIIPIVRHRPWLTA